MSAEKTELRGLVPTELAAALDAIAMSKGMNRNDYVNLVLDAECKRVCHESMVIHRVLRGNPYLSDSHGLAREPASRLHGDRS